MKTEFDQEFEKLMTEDKEIPSHVRKRLDSTYDMIQTQSKRKKKKTTWMRVTAAACTVLISTGLLANEQVRAGIGNFFLGQDKGIEKALVEGFGEVNHHTVTDEDVTVTLEQNFSDKNKIGLGFQLTFEDPSLLVDDLTEVSMDYRLKNGDGEYISEFIPDTKQLKGEAHYTAGHKEEFIIVNQEKGIVRYDVVIESNKGNLPQLTDALVEIESIHLFNEMRELKVINGTWHLPLTNKYDNIPAIAYVQVDSHKDIEIVSAIASPTSLNMELIVEPGTLYSDGLFMKMIDDSGVEYESEGYNVVESGDKFNVNVNFPISTYHQAENLRLVIENLGEVELRNE